GGGAQQTLGNVAFAALGDQFDQAVAFQGTQVVVHLLPGQPEPCGQHGGGGGLGELGQQPGSGGIQGGLGDGGVVDHGDVEHHAATLSPTSWFVKTASVVGCPCVTSARLTGKKTLKT